MSDENKKLSDDLENMIGDAKEGAKRAAEKAEEFAEEAKEKVEGAKEKAVEFADDAKEKLGEFADDAKKVFSDAKNVAIIAHVTLIGWVIALIMNRGEKKNEFASFYIRQVLGIGLLGLAVSFIPIIGWLAWILILVLWVMSLIGAIGGEKKTVFLLGEQFQDWFKSL